MNGIKQVPSFKTSDGTLHPTRLQALLAERKIELRGIVQSGPDGVPLKNGNLTVQEAVTIMIQNSQKIAERCRYYSQAIKREQAKGAAAV